MHHTPLAALSRRILIALIGLPCALFSSMVIADDNKLLGFSTTPGIGVRLMDLTVSSKADGSRGTITNDGSFFSPMYVAVDIESPAYPLSDKVGVSVRSYATKFSLDTQRVESSGSTKPITLPRE